MKITDNEIKRAIKEHLNNILGEALAGQEPAMLAQGYRDAAKPPARKIAKTSPDQAAKVKAIQSALGIKSDGIYGSGTQTAVGQWYSSKGIQHHGHKDWASKINEEYNDIVGGGATGGGPDLGGGPISGVGRTGRGGLNDKGGLKKATVTTVGPPGPMLPPSDDGGAIGGGGAGGGGGGGSQGGTYSGELTNWTAATTPWTATYPARSPTAQNFNDDMVQTIINDLGKQRQLRSMWGMDDAAFANKAAMNLMKTPEAYFGFLSAPVRNALSKSGIIVPGAKLKENKVIFSKSYIKQVIKEEMRKVLKKKLK